MWNGVSWFWRKLTQEKLKVFGGVFGSNGFTTLNITHNKNKNLYPLVYPSSVALCQNLGLNSPSPQNIHHHYHGSNQYANDLPTTVTSRDSNFTGWTNTTMSHSTSSPTVASATGLIPPGAFLTTTTTDTTTFNALQLLPGAVLSQWMPLLFWPI